ncbi:hypothetical protein IFM89_015993 [Coptis chinensis]|uniref:Uncharacterized protein n=1 Tax=Coptis chinensis TaxID=261450 RepID=A0A835HMI7_9MAGN|nr:hypothetical protein IFM89_015993 [Coptis chinensis]
MLLTSFHTSSGYNYCLQLKNKDQSISTLFPVFLPYWADCCDIYQQNKYRNSGIRYIEREGHYIIMGFVQSPKSKPVFGFSLSSFPVLFLPPSLKTKKKLCPNITTSPLCFSTLEVDYGSEENARIVYAALAVDKELQPDRVKRQMIVSDGKLSVRFEAVEARFLRMSFTSFVDILTLATKTIEEFGPGMEL